jgi:prepilin-type N-terminal cleavage/methylation domain-containing protein
MFKDTLHPGSKSAVIRQKHGAGFTITELLVVIGIMGLLLMVAVPSFQSASRGGKLRSAVFNLNTAFSLARQTAISTRQNVYLLFPDDAPELYQGLPPDTIAKAYRTYAMFGHRDGYLTEWRELPPGIIIDPDFEIGIFRNLFQLGNGELYLLRGMATDRPVEVVRFPTNDSSVREIYGLGFRSDGPTHRGGLDRTYSATIVLSEGWTDYDPVAGVFQGWNYVPDIPIQAIRINAVTGQSQIRELIR